jgi:hypothetical protein
MLRRSLSCLALLAALAGTSARASIGPVQPPAATPRQYARAEWTISLTERFQDPYYAPDIALDMVLYTPGGRTIALPCYYDSGASGAKSAWKAHFAPQETGVYTYFFRLTRPGREAAVTKESHFTVEPGAGRGFLHPNNNWTLRFDNGERFRAIGENICWEARAHDDSKFFAKLHEDPRFNFDHMIDLLTRNGGNFLRVWLCPWSLPLETRHPVNTNRYTDSSARFNPSSFARIDHLTELAESRGAYIMLALTGGADLNEYSAAHGGPAPTREAFFTDPTAKLWYKSRLRYLVARWGASPAIGAWEFFNEVDNTMHGPGDKVLVPYADVTAWHAEMAAYLKAIDPYGHIVTTSISHRDIAGLNDIPAIDINQKHIYRATEAIPAAIASYEARHGKPYVIGEFGYHWDWSVDFRPVAAEFDYDYRRGLWYGLFSPTPILPMSWWWEFFEDRGMMPTFAPVREISDRMLTAGHGAFEPASASASTPGMQTMAVLCGATRFVYVLNNTQSPAATALTIDIGSAASANVSLYTIADRSVRSLGRIERTANGLSIPDLALSARADAVVIVEP